MVGSNESQGLGVDFVVVVTIHFCIALLGTTVLLPYYGSRDMTYQYDASAGRCSTGTSYVPVSKFD